MAKKLQKRFMVELGGISWGKKDTAKISATAKFDTAKMDAGEVQALLAAGQLHCRLDKGDTSQGKLPIGDGDQGMPVTTVEFDATCHRISMDLGTFSFGLSFPKTAATANILAEFAGADAKLIVTRTGELGVTEAEEGEEAGDEEGEE